jgi:hypothetical protein
MDDIIFIAVMEDGSFCPSLISACFVQEEA